MVWHIACFMFVVLTIVVSQVIVIWAAYLNRYYCFIFILASFIDLSPCERSIGFFTFHFSSLGSFFVFFYFWFSVWIISEDSSGFYRGHLRGRFSSQTIMFLMGHSVARYIRSHALLTLLTYLAALCLLHSAHFTCFLHSWVCSLTSLIPL